MEAQNDFLDNLADQQHDKMLREIWEDDLTPRKRRKNDGELYERAIIQNLEMKIHIHRMGNCLIRINVSK